MQKKDLVKIANKYDRDLTSMVSITTEVYNKIIINSMNEIYNNFSSSNKPPDGFQVNNYIDDSIGNMDAALYILFGFMASKKIIDIARKNRILTHDSAGSIIQSYMTGIDFFNSYMDKKVKQDVKESEKILKHIIQETTDNFVIHKKELTRELKSEVDDIFVEHTHQAKRQIKREKIKYTENNINKIIQENMSVLDLKDRFQHIIDRYVKKWELLSDVHINSTFNTANIHMIQKYALNNNILDPDVVIINIDDDRVTEFCKSHSRDDNNQLVSVKMSELKPSNHNLGKPKKDWVNSFPLRHFNCRCKAFILPDNYIFEDGFLKKGSK